jgi:hypothetical protein
MTGLGAGLVAQYLAVAPGCQRRKSTEILPLPHRRPASWQVELNQRAFSCN